MISYLAFVVRFSGSTYGDEVWALLGHYEARSPKLAAREARREHRLADDVEVVVVPGSRVTIP